MKAKKTAGRPKRRTHHIKVWRNPMTGEWRWNVTATNGRLVAWSGETYRNRVDCVNALLHLVDGILQNRVSVSDEGLKG
jgi:uncharacterized protein YegP (UPF0339 family)